MNETFVTIFRCQGLWFKVKNRESKKKSKTERSEYLYISLIYDLWRLLRMSLCNDFSGATAPNKSCRGSAQW